MSEDTFTPPTPASAPARRAVRWTVAAVALVVLGWAVWYFGEELPRQELVRLRAANARTIPDLKLDLVWLAPGTFKMGSPEQSLLARWFYEAREKLTGNPNLGRMPPPPMTLAAKMMASIGGKALEMPVTRVTLTHAFWLGRTEVTQAQWTAVMGSNPSEFKGDDLPVEMVSWDDAMAFC